MRFILLFFIPVFVFAARPLITDDAGIVEKGLFEFEFGFDLTRSGEWSRETYLQLKHGLTDRFDIGVSLPYDFESFGKPELIFKCGILKDNEKIPDISLGLKNVLSREFGINLILSKDFGYVIGHLNIAYIFDVKNFSGSFAIELPLKEKLNFCSDIFISKVSDESVFEGLIGLRLSLFEKLSTDIGFSMNNDREIKITSGLTFNF